MSVRMRHTAGEGASDTPVRSNHFKCARTRWIGLLEMPLYIGAPLRAATECLLIVSR
jgi:hypothetical protein